MEKGYKLIGRTSVLYGANTHGVISTYLHERGGVGKDHLLYILRAGKKGTGKQMASAKCLTAVNDYTPAPKTIGATSRTRVAHNQPALAAL